MSSSIPLVKARGSLSRQLYAALRESIRSGAFRNGDKLPSTRDLAEQLGVSRTVALAAYDHLVAEGFAAGRPGSGTSVACRWDEARVPTPRQRVKVRLSRFGDAAAAAWSKGNVPARPAPRLLYPEATIVSAAATRGVGVYGISPDFMRRAHRTGLLRGYSRLNEGEIREGIRRRLSNVL